MNVVEVQGLEKLQKRLQAMQSKYEKVEDVFVGYTQPYAIYVHEATRMTLKGVPRKKPSIGRYWDPPGSGPKFLEKPARELAGILGSMIATLVKRGVTFQDAIYKAGVYLQYQSQRLVPIDFGALFASAFTAKESELEQKSADAYAKSMMFRNRRTKKT